MYAGGESRLRTTEVISGEEARRRQAERGVLGAKKTYPDVKARQRELYERHFGHPPPPGILE